MATPALEAAGATLGGRDLAPRAIAAAAAAMLTLLLMIAAPLAILSSTSGGSGEITQPANGIPPALVPVFNEASRVYAVNAYLLASIADQESTFGTGPRWRTVNSAGCL